MGRLSRSICLELAREVPQPFPASWSLEITGDARDAAGDLRRQLQEIRSCGPMEIIERVQELPKAARQPRSCRFPSERKGARCAGALIGAARAPQERPGWAQGAPQPFPDLGKPGDLRAAQGGGRAIGGLLY